MELGEKNTFSHTIQMLLYDHGKANHGNKNLPGSIYMVPSVFRDLSPVSFKPRVVSIGPLHRGDENLQEYEGTKVEYLRGLLGRVDSPIDQTLKTCLLKVHDSIYQVRKCYPDMEKTTYTDVELAKMMVVDACFILELFLRYVEFEDSIRRNLLVTQYLIHDLLLLENQIPFFVLKHIFECTILKFKPEACLTSFIFLVLNFFEPFRQFLNIDKIVTGTNIDHILGLLQKSYHPTVIPFGLDINLSQISWFKNPTAEELESAGVNFKPNRHADWRLAIKFELSRFPSMSWCWGKPTLKMPLLCINDFTELVLRNLIAYEQCSGIPSYVTSYAAFMDMLVNTQDDVAKLVESDVIDNRLGSNEEAANMINKICKEVAHIGSPYHSQLAFLDSYYNGYWPKNIAWLRRKYFSSPWNFIALVAAIILFALTVIQTVKAM